MADTEVAQANPKPFGEGKLSLLKCLCFFDCLC